LSFTLSNRFQNSTVPKKTGAFLRDDGLFALKCNVFEHRHRKIVGFLRDLPATLAENDFLYLRGSQSAFLAEFLLSALADISVRDAEDRKEIADSI